MTRHIAATLLLFSLSALGSMASAGEIKDFSQAEFDRLAQAGKPVVVDVAAGWCPMCKAQKPILERLMKQPAYQDVTMLKVDFDTQKDALRTFKVGMQGTLVGFQGAKEVARSVGDTSEAGIGGLVRKTLN